jgi:hypothetical protein
MHRRMTRTVLAVSVAGVTAALGLTAAGAATAASALSVNAPPGAWPVYTNANCVAAISSNCGMAGYEATGRDFRYAAASITVPTGGDVDSTSPHIYVGLSDATGAFARAGIVPCSPGVSPCSAIGWEGFFEVYQEGLPLLDTAGGYFVPVPLTGVTPGHAVSFSVYFNEAGNADRFTETLPNGNTITQAMAVNGPIYSSAEAVADWTGVAAAPAPVAPGAPGITELLTQISQGAFTTDTGQQGSLYGPWTTSPVEVTTNGNAPGTLVSSGTLIAAPTPISNDAFGVWLS